MGVWRQGYGGRRELGTRPDGLGLGVHRQCDIGGLAAPRYPTGVSTRPLSAPSFDQPCRKQHPGANLLMGGAAGTVAATVCYPLDTIRRRMQMKGQMYSSQASC